ncbi:MAG: membrane protein insertion efficiency factor YidD, partial [Planctomycetaceae bacterium]
MTSPRGVFGPLPEKTAVPDPVNEGRAGAGSLASRCRDAARWCGNLPARGLIALVRIYQYTLSPFIGRQCRFEPTCSHYFIGCVQKYGAVRGA